MNKKNECRCPYIGDEALCFGAVFDTYIIAFCPDTREFFVTNTKGYFWEYDIEFSTESEGVNFFINNLETFIKKQNEIYAVILVSNPHYVNVFLSNTGRYYTTETTL